MYSPLSPYPIGQREQSIKARKKKAGWHSNSLLREVDPIMLWGKRNCNRPEGSLPRRTNCHESFGITTLTHLQSDHGLMELPSIGPFCISGKLQTTVPRFLSVKLYSGFFLPSDTSHCEVSVAFVGEVNGPSYLALLAEKTIHLSPCPRVPNTFFPHLLTQREFVHPSSPCKFGCWVEEIWNLRLKWFNIQRQQQILLIPSEIFGHR